MNECPHPTFVAADARGFKYKSRGSEGIIRLLFKVKLDVAANERFVEPAVDAIVKGAHSGKIGDGKIFILPMDQCVRIRTGETGSVAIGP